MFHWEIRHRFHWLSKSWIINVIWFFHAYWFAITFFVLPLYLFSIFQSEFIVWKIESISSLFWIFFTASISFLILKMKKHILLKIWFLTGIIWIFYFIFVKTFFDANIARILLRVSAVFIIAILTLYLREFTSPKELVKKEWIYSAVINFSWLTWPIVAWFLLNTIHEKKDWILDNLPFLKAYWDWLEYNILLFIGSLLLIISIFIFIFWKFVIKHPHLQKNKISKQAKEIHKLSNLRIILEYFKNKKRTIAFVSDAFKWFWMIILYVFLWIFLIKNWVSNYLTWIIIWLMCLPNVLIEPLAWKISNKIWDEINVMLYWYFIFWVFLTMALIIWIENFYLFTLFLILSQIWFAIIEPLNDSFYFEWTTKENQDKFFSVYKLADAIARFATPFCIWFFISIYSIEAAFFIIPIIISLVFLFVFLVKKYKIQ